MLRHCVMYRDPMLRAGNLFSMYTSPALLGHARPGKHSRLAAGLFFAKWPICNKKPDWTAEITRPEPAQVANQKRSVIRKRRPR